MNTVYITRKADLPKTPKTEYEFGQEFVAQLVTDHKDEVNRLLKKYVSKDLVLASSERKKEALKKLMKDQNNAFVLELSQYIAKLKDKRGTIKPLRTVIRPVSVELNTRQFNSTGGVYWSLGKEKYDEALEWLQKQGYSADAAETILSTKGENAPELKDWKEGKKPFDWNLAMETTGKVAQSIFYLGSIFSKKEDPAPTMTDSDNKTTQTQNNLTRNIVIAVVVIAVLGTVAYFMFKKPTK